jgi:hypothetical protein
MDRRLRRKSRRLTEKALHGVGKLKPIMRAGSQIPGTSTNIDIIFPFLIQSSMSSIQNSKVSIQRQTAFAKIACSSWQPGKHAADHAKNLWNALLLLTRRTS